MARIVLPLETRFWPKVWPEPMSGCWLWSGATANGYGYILGSDGRRGGKIEKAARIAWQLCVGPIPEGHELDHLCRNHNCVNPQHLEPVTHQVNCLRGISPVAKHAKKTHCPKGHHYIGSNVVIYNGSRSCRICGNLQSEKYRSIHREEMNQKRRDKRKAIKNGSIPA